MNWNVNVQRGTQKLNATYTNFAVCNGQHEAGFDEYRKVFSRAYNATLSDFDNWLPSLTYLCQGMFDKVCYKQYIVYIMTLF